MNKSGTSASEVTYYEPGVMSHTQLESFLKRDPESLREPEGVYDMFVKAAKHSEVYGDCMIAIACGYSPNVLGGCGYSPLVDVIYDVNIDPIQKLLNAGADPNLKDDMGRTALHLMSIGDPGKWKLWSYPDVVKNIVQMLVSHDANVNATDHFGWSPLHYAAWYTVPFMVEALMRHGADPNLAAKLDLANVDDRLILDFKETIKLLKGSKCTSVFKSKRSWTPLELAIVSSQTHIGKSRYYYDY